MNETYYRDKHCELADALTAAKRYLADTDYVVIKLYEAKINGEDTLPLETEYADVLAERKRVRATIDGLEAQIEEIKIPLQNELALLEVEQQPANGYQAHIPSFVNRGRNRK